MIPRKPDIQSTIRLGANNEQPKLSSCLLRGPPVCPIYGVAEGILKGFYCCCADYYVSCD
ncbi:hypothetical protein T08_4807 [Trichinella sp. T8]|nr:hypothetical protein T08_4807 [Trichinella sp. T8]